MLQKKSLWKNKDFVLFWVGQFISNIGSAISSLVFPLLILDLTKSAFHVGVVSAISIIPYVVLGMHIGVYLDHADRKRVMRYADMVRFLTLMSAPIASYTIGLSIYHIYILSLINGVAYVFHSIAEVTSLPNIVEKECLTQANSITYASANIARLIGPAIGGGLYAQYGGEIAITIDAFSFLIAFCSLVIIKKKFQVSLVTSLKKINIKGNFKEGLNYVFSTPLIRILVIIIAYTQFISAPYYLYNILFLRDNLHCTPAILGLLLGLASIGGIVGSLIAPKLRNLITIRSLLLILLLIDLGSRVLLPLFSIPLMVVLFLIIVYAAQGIINVIVISLRQEVVPDHILARVNSAFRTVVFSLNPLGYFIGGIIVEKLGAQSALLLTAFLYLFIIVFVLINYKNINLKTLGNKHATDS